MTGNAKEISAKSKDTSIYKKRHYTLRSASEYFEVHKQIKITTQFLEGGEKCTFGESTECPTA